MRSSGDDLLSEEVMGGGWQRTQLPVTCLDFPSTSSEDLAWYAIYAWWAIYPLSDILRLENFLKVFPRLQGTVIMDEIKQPDGRLCHSSRFKVMCELGM